MTITIAIANQKGGVGKTTSAVAYGHGLTAYGKRVLIVDLDSQGNVAMALGLDEDDGLYRLLVEKEPLKKVVLRARESPNGGALDVVRGNKRTNTAKLEISGMNFREVLLKVALKKSPYDVILLDCAPSSDVLHIAALVASDYLLIPTSPDPMAIKGVSEMVATLAELRELEQTRAQLLGVQLCFYDRRTRETREQIKVLESAFPKLLWPFIPDDVHAREAPAHGQTLWEYAPKTAALYGVVDEHYPTGYVAGLKRLVGILS